MQRISSPLASLITWYWPSPARLLASDAREDLDAEASSLSHETIGKLAAANAVRKAGVIIEPFSDGGLSAGRPRSTTNVSSLHVRHTVPPLNPAGPPPTTTRS